jgi:alpha-tubulin suppressor-like RCC1 family protein
VARQIDSWWLQEVSHVRATRNSTPTMAPNRRTHRLLASTSARSGFSHVAAGTFTTCGTTAAGALYCWGSNQSGELGTGEAYGSNRPITAVGTSGWQTVAAGYHYFCAIQNGALYCWGTNSHGELGHNQDLVPSAVVSH